MTNLDNEMNRIATFANWQLNYPSGLNLARAGLAYTGTGDTVYCYKCHCVISDWRENDVPIERHRHQSPNCPLVASCSLPVYRSPPGSSITHPSDDVNQPQNPVHPPRLYQPGKSSSMPLPSAPSQMPKSNTSSLRMDDIQTGHLKIESQRLRTFDSWMNSFVNGRDLAKAGLFYTGIGDCVKCAFCSGILKQWERGDVPLDEHRKHFPKCPFVLGLNVGNRPEGRMVHDQPTRTPVMQPQDSVAATGGGGRGYSPFPDFSPYETRNSLNFDVKFADMEQRLCSYENMPLPRGQKREVLAAAGFYYVGPGDSVKCFQCGGVLKKWSETDKPWIEHAKWFPNCIFVLQAKGYKFINDIQQQFNGSCVPVEPRTENSSEMESSNDDTMLKTSIQEEEHEESTSLKQKFLPSNISTSNPSAASSGTVNMQHPLKVTHPSEMPSSPSISLPTSSTNPLQPSKGASEDLTTMAKENERLRDAIQCKICMDAMANTVFLPCGHLLCCENCAPAINDCPVCRGIIKGTLKVFIS